MTELVRWQDPFRELVSLRDAMDRLFEESFVRPFGWVSPVESAMALDMYETDDNLVIKAALPGVLPENVDVTIEGDRLRIEGEVKADEEMDKGKVHIRERRYGKFSRVILLPTDVQSDKAKAEFKDGILTLTLPKAEELKPKRIKISTAK
jgi:HSP20 family protein